MSAKAKSKKNKNRTKASRGQVTEVTNKKVFLDYLPSITLAAAAVLIFYPPFFQGLFFPEEMFITHFLTGLVLLLVIVQKWQQRDFAFLRTPLDWAVAAFTLAYLISLIGAVHPGEAWYGFLKVLNYFAIYLIISNVIRNFDDIQTLTRVLVASGVGVAAIGILAALGYSDYPGAFQGGTIYSTLQYSNTTAAFLAVLSLIATGLWTRERGRLLKVIYLLAISIMTLVVLATFSKGAWLIYGVGAVLLIIGMPGVYRFKAIYGLTASWVAAAVTFQKFYPAVTAESTSAVSYLLIGAMVVLAAAFLWEVLEYLYRSKGAVTVALTTILLLIIIAVPLGTFGQEFLSGQDITQELSGLLDFENSSYTARMDFNRWGWDIVKDYPVNGTGAGGWNALYHQYQDYLLWATDAHNHFLQVWIEAGSIGFLAWIFMIVAFVYSLSKIKRSLDPKKWILVWGLGCAALALLAHSILDFDFSIPAISLVYWAMLAIVNGIFILNVYSAKPFSRYKYIVANFAILSIVSATLLITGTSYWSALNYSIKGSAAIEKMASGTSLNQNNELYDSALNNYQKAVALDSRNPRYKAEVAYLNAVGYRALGQEQVSASGSFFRQTLDQIEESKELAPHDAQVYNRLIEAAAMLGDPEIIKQLAEERVASNPLDITAYTLLADVLWEGMQASIRANNPQSATRYAEQLVTVEKKVENQKTLINSARGGDGKKLELSSEILDKIRQARIYLKDE